MTPKKLTSKDHPLARKIRLVALRGKRAPADLVLAEGLRVLEEATLSGQPVEAVVVSEHFGRRSNETALLRQWQSRKLRIYSATGPLLKSLSGVMSPQGALALIRVPILTLDRVALPDNSLVLCACGIQDPGNLGTLLRTALAAGVSLFCSTSGTVSARNLKSVRASAGTFFRLPSVEGVDPPAFLRFCRKHGIRLLRADAYSGSPYSANDYQVPTAILLGNESRGIPQTEWKKVSAIHIPMAQGVESLNVAAAGSILMFEAHRQRTQSQPGELCHDPISVL